MFAGNIRNLFKIYINVLFWLKKNLKRVKSRKDVAEKRITQLLSFNYLRF